MRHTRVELPTITGRRLSNRQSSPPGGDASSACAHSPASGSSWLGETCLDAAATCQLSSPAHLGPGGFPGRRSWKKPNDTRCQKLSASQSADVGQTPAVTVRAWPSRGARACDLSPAPQDGSSVGEKKPGLDRTASPMNAGEGTGVRASAFTPPPPPRLSRTLRGAPPSARRWAPRTYC